MLCPTCESFDGKVFMQVRNRDVQRQQLLEQRHTHTITKARVERSKIRKRIRIFRMHDVVVDLCQSVSQVTLYCDFSNFTRCRYRNRSQIPLLVCNMRHACWMFGENFLPSKQLEEFNAEFREESEQSWPPSDL